jgi:hypothetical protein
MVWYFLLCTGWANPQCLPAQVMPTESACMLIRNQYVTGNYVILARCVGVRKP